MKVGEGNEVKKSYASTVSAAPAGTIQNESISNKKGRIKVHTPQGRLSIGHCLLLDAVLIHFSMQCI